MRLFDICEVCSASTLLVSATVRSSSRSTSHTRIHVPLPVFLVKSETQLMAKVALLAERSAAKYACTKAALMKPFRLGAPCARELSRSFDRQQTAWRYMRSVSADLRYLGRPQQSFPTL